MLTTTTNTIPRFIELYEGRLREWAGFLTSQTGIVVAISRKGPRLLEMLGHYGILPRRFFERVISEHALTFLNDREIPTIITDDAVCYGSTFRCIYNLTVKTLHQWGNPESVKAVPFAIVEGACDKFEELNPTSFLRLQNKDFGPFVNNEVWAFRLIGKPFDIEYPMLTYDGDFGRFQEVEALLKDVAREIGGTLIPITRSVTAEDGPITCPAWTLVLEPPSYAALNRPEVCKLRIYLDGEATKLTVAAMVPVRVTRSDLQRAVEWLPRGLTDIWVDVVFRGPKSDGASQSCAANERSKAILANFLFAMPLLRQAKDYIDGALSEYNIGNVFLGPGIDDLRLLIGPTHAKQAEVVLNDYLAAKPRPAHSIPHRLKATDIDIPGMKLPEEYVPSYEKELATLKSNVRDVYEAMEVVFYAQHRGIEVPSRIESTAADERLEFGITFAALYQTIRRLIPEAKEPEVHRCLDRLIDESCIVPRYIRFGSDNNPVWVRAFRVGEGTFGKLAKTTNRLIRSLAAAIGKEEVPPVLLEKYCTLVLSSAKDYLRLKPIERLDGLSKAYHLYGARMVVECGQRESALLDWAVEYGIASRAGRDSAGEESGGDYRAEDINPIYPEIEEPWDEQVRDAIEDFALFAALVQNTKGLRTDALVLVTSLATPEETKKAVEAGLGLWLHDRYGSVYKALQALAELREPLSSGGINGGLKTEKFEGINKTLSRTALFISKALEKKRLSARKEEIYDGIGVAVKENVTARRVWRDVLKTLRSRESSEQDTSGFSPVISALKAAYGTNRLIRDLLSFSGYKDPEGRSKPLDVSLVLLRDRLRELITVDPVAKVVFAAKDGRPDILLMIEDVIPLSFRSYQDAHDAIAPIILEIASRCEHLLRAYGTEQFKESPIILSLPRFVLLWDVRGSTEADSRQDDVDPLIMRANTRINETLGDRIFGFSPGPESLDDGNGLVCNNFEDVLAVFSILCDVFVDIPVRAGVEANIQGLLYYYPSAQSLGGRAYEHAARVSAMFKGIKESRERWIGETAPTEPEGSYLVVGEFARRFAEFKGEWGNSTLLFTEVVPDGYYVARVNNSLPIAVTLLIPPSDQGNEAGLFSNIAHS